LAGSIAGMSELRAQSAKSSQHPTLIDHRIHFSTLTENIKKLEANPAN